MTQKELDFIQEACYEKIQRMLIGIVSDQDELQMLRVHKKEQEKVEKPKKQ